MTTVPEVYLGDGLYASFDGLMITLRAPREHGNHWVGLEPSVLRAFDEFRKRIEDQYRAREEASP